MFYLLTIYQVLSMSAINMTLDLMSNPLGVVATEELEDMLLDDDDDDFIAY